MQIYRFYLDYDEDRGEGGFVFGPEQTQTKVHHRKVGYFDASILIGGRRVRRGEGGGGGGGRRGSNSHDSDDRQKTNNETT